MNCIKNEMQEKWLTILLVVSITSILGVSCAVAVFVENGGSNNTSPSGNIHERTFILLKPDTVQRGLIGRIIQRFEAKGFKLVAINFMWPSKERIEEHYKERVHPEFYSRLVNQMISGPVVPMVWEGLNAVQISRRMIGPTETNGSTPGTIRGDFSIDVLRNAIHGAHSIESANREINLWFNKSELNSWTPANIKWTYE